MISIFMLLSTLQEDDIKAKLNQRDTIIYHDNDFEVFLDPDCDGQNYFEIELMQKLLYLI